MATWQEIGIDNFQAGRELFDTKRYRSSVSRFYYATFSILTHELSHAGVSFGNNLETPGHQGLPKLLKLHLTLPTRQKAEVIAISRRLYAARINADYQRRTTDAITAQDAMRDTANLFRYLEINHD